MKNKNYLFRKLLILLIICLIFVCLSACSKMSGTYAAENPNDPNMLIPSMTFDGGEVIFHLGNVGIQNMVCEYKIKGDQLLLGDSITINGKTFPQSFTYVEIDEKTIELDGVRYILSK